MGPRRLSDVAGRPLNFTVRCRFSSNRSALNAAAPCPCGRCLALLPHASALWLGQSESLVRDAARSSASTKPSCTSYSGRAWQRS